ncbi:helix-turn-helix domain-containing protein [Sodalis glossinidius]|uniref:helix-turn-helix domain-containing protein n=1 Tax=Sodalis glossinidius TaxID=63612 RepID=UPI001FB0F79E|nr:helix-turn-helix domain-containing protein [Sodalis glossinidius]
MLTPLDKAVLAVGGRQKTLAERLDISAQAVSQIKKRGGGTSPKKRMKDLLVIIGLKIEELYPDIFSH